MEGKTCTMCNMEKHIDNFYKTYSECKDCNRTRGLKRYYGNKKKYRINRNYIMKKTEKKRLLQKQNNRWLQFEDLVTSYVQLENRLKTMEEKFLMNDSEIN